MKLCNYPLIASLIFSVNRKSADLQLVSQSSTSKPWKGVLEKLYFDQWPYIANKNIQQMHLKFTLKLAIIRNK